MKNVLGYGESSPLSLSLSLSGSFAARRPSNSERLSPLFLSHHHHRRRLRRRQSFLEGAFSSLSSTQQQGQSQHTPPSSSQASNIYTSSSKVLLRGGSAIKSADANFRALALQTRQGLFWPSSFPFPLWHNLVTSHGRERERGRRERRGESQRSEKNRPARPPFYNFDHAKGRRSNL